MTQFSTTRPKTERALTENARYAATFDRPNLEPPPSRKLAVLACMDARLTVEQVLGLRTGEAHIIRNTGGLATDDAIRSLVVLEDLGYMAAEVAALRPPRIISRPRSGSGRMSATGRAGLEVGPGRRPC